MKSKSTVMAFTLLMGLGMFHASFTASANDLVVEIERVVVNSELRPEVTFTLRDASGAPLQRRESGGSLEDVATGGIIMAYLTVVDAEAGKMFYTSYTTRIQTVPEGFPNAGVSAEQAAYDSGGTYTELEPGRYLYTFGTALPADYDRTLTHTVSGQFERTVNGVRHVSNPVHHFVPFGGEVTTLKRVSETESCNACHTNLGFHGGARMEYTLCLMCHNPQTIDPDTGHSLDMNVMIHKIHRGANLPSVQAGEPYQIVGRNQSVADFSTVHYPMDIRNCDSCHTGPEAHIYTTALSAASCGSCHDHVNFITGANHGPGIPVPDDNACKNCHRPSGQEFDISVLGAHTVPYKSEKLRGLIAEIIRVDDAAPGSQPSVLFTLTENDGSSVALSSLQSINITFAGPTTDYTSYVRENAITAVEEGGAWRYLFNGLIPENAQGSYAFAMEARRQITLVDNPEGMADVTVTEAARNPVYYTAVTGDEVITRREVVELDRCNTCHDNLTFHGGQRNDTAFCVMCHNPRTSDIARRTEEVGGGESISMAYMIHKIHAGEDLSQPFTVYGFGNVAHDYTHLRFPGNRRDCTMCHTEMPTLPLPETVQHIDFVNRDGEQVFIAKTSGSCLSCHDSTEAQAHAQMFTQPDGTETCQFCHGPNTSHDIARVHQLDRVLTSEVTFGDGVAIFQWLMHQ